MNFVMYWFGGYLRFLLKGACAERFLNLCLYHGIPLRNIRYCSHPVIEVPLRYFCRIREIAYKSGCIVVLQQKGGFPFFVHKYRRQAMFCVGMLSAFLLIRGMSSRIWNVTIMGNQVYTDDILIQFMEDNGYTAGMGKKAVSCDDLEQMLRNNYERISWVSARLEGTRLIVEVRESEPQLEEKIWEPGDLTAETDGIIVEIVTRSGIPQVKAGDVVTAGQVLISGQVPVYDDSAALIELHPVSADGDIRIQREIVYQDQFSAVWEKRTYQSSQKRPWLLIGSLYLDIPFLHLPGQENKELERDTVKSNYQVRLFEDFYLPVYCGFVTERFFSTEEVAYTEEECKKIAQEHILRYLEENTKDGNLISSDCTIKIRNNICYVSGELIFTEDAGSLTPIPQTEEVEEDETPAS